MRDFSTDVPDFTPKTLCSFGITEGLAAIIGTTLGSAGVGAATAGGIGSAIAGGVVPSLVGGGLSMLMGKPFGQGALMGGALGMMGSALGGGQGMVPGLGTPSAAGAQGSVPNVGSDSFVHGADPQLASMDYPTAAGQGTSAPIAAGRAVAGGLGGSGGSLAQLMALGSILSHQSAPQPQPGVLFNRPLQTTGYLNRSQVPVQTPPGGWQSYGYGPEQQFYSGNQLNFARGGALSQAKPISTSRGQHYVRGGDTGQSDTKNAKLSDGEYVMDAGTVSRLGDGNSEAGAKRLDMIREAIAHDTKSNDVVQRKAKPPLAYLREARRA